MPRRPHPGAVAAAKSLIAKLRLEHPREIDIELIAAYHRLLVRRLPMEHEEGRLLRTARRGIINVSEAAFESAKWRFVIAHEIGHFIRHPENDSFAACTRGDLSNYAVGGREAEALFFDDVSWGYGNDLSRATDIARALVEDYGLAGDVVGMRRVELSQEDPVSEVTKAALDHAIGTILETQRKRARDILTANKPLVGTLRDLLVEKKVLDTAALTALFPTVTKKDPVASER